MASKIARLAGSRKSRLPAVFQQQRVNRSLSYSATRLVENADSESAIKRPQGTTHFGFKDVPESEKETLGEFYIYFKFCQ